MLGARRGNLKKIEVFLPTSSHALTSSHEPNAVTFQCVIIENYLALLRISVNVLNS